MASTQELDTVSTKIQRIAELAKCHPERSFVSLSHHIDPHWLWEAYERIRKDGVVVIDGITAETYEEDLLSLTRTPTLRDSSLRSIRSVRMGVRVISGLLGCPDIY
jgi:hypothetical protein